MTGCKESGSDSAELSGLQYIGSTELTYAEQFSIDNYSGDISVITIGEEKYIVVPENCTAAIPDGMTVITKPQESIYLAASSAMDLFDGIGALENICATATAENSWSLPNVKEAIDCGSILYAGKYSAPDFELLLSEGCSLAIESTMIYHKPEIKEQLEEIGIPVLVERSSYESHPLGRLEWIKLYGILTDREEEAEEIFNRQAECVNSIMSEEKTGKIVAFFYISSNGYVNVRKPGDYISKMIELAGGEYIFTADDMNVDENALSTINMQFETFYAIASEADILIYNSTVDGGVDTISQLTEKNGMLADFKAVKNGDVWCTESNMFQQTTGTADMISDMHKIFTDEADDEMNYLHRLK